MKQSHKDYIVCDVHKLHVVAADCATHLRSPTTCVIPKNTIVNILGNATGTTIADTNGVVWHTHTGINEILDRYDESRMELAPSIEETSALHPEPIKTFYVVGTEKEIRGGSGDTFDVIPYTETVRNLLERSGTLFLARIVEYPHIFSGEFIAHWDIVKSDWEYMLEPTVFTVSRR